MNLESLLSLSKASQHALTDHNGVISSLINVNLPTSNIDYLDQYLGSPLPPGWEQCLDLKSGIIFYKDLSTGNTTKSDPRLLKNGDSIHSANSPFSKEVFKPIIQWDSNNAQQLAPIGERLTANDPHHHDIDLDLRLSSYFNRHQPLSTSSASSSSISYSSASCLSDHVTNPIVDHVPHKIMGDNCSTDSGQESLCNNNSGTPRCSSASSPPSTMSFQPHEDDDDYDANDEGLVEPLKEVQSFLPLPNHQEPNQETNGQINPVEETSMATAACMRCLMYVLLLSSEDPRCPRCGCDAMLLNNM